MAKNTKLNKDSELETEDVSTNATPELNAEQDIPKPPVSSAKTKKKEEKEEMVQVSKSELASILEKLDENKKTIDLLYKAADQGRISKIQAQNQDLLIKTCNVSLWPSEDGDRLVVGWKLTKNQCEIINGRWVEDQRTLLLFEDGGTLEISILDFARKLKKERVEILARSTEVSGETGKQSETLTVKRSDGRKLKIGLQFIN